MKKLAIAVTAGLALVSASSAFAQRTEGWNFEVTPYIWYAGLEGDVTVDGQKTDFEKDASDLFKAVEAGGSLRIGASYDRLVFGALVDAFSLNTDEMDVEDQPAGGRMESDLLMIEGMVGYRVDGWSEGQSFVIGVGARRLDMDMDLEVFGKGTRSKETEVVDGMLFVLPSMPVLPSMIEGLRFNPVLAIGAGDSDLAYEMFPQFQYQITENLAARFGYRTVGWKFKGDENEDNELNVRLAGLIAGIGLTW